MMDSFYNALFILALIVSRCNSIIIEFQIFGYVLYIPRVGSFAVNALVYCDMRHVYMLLAHNEN
jgi:hypothetical protein